LSVGDSLPDKAEDEASGAVQDVIEPGCPRYDRLVINNNPAVVFALPPNNSPDDEPRRMSQRLATKINGLAVMLASMPEIYGAGATLHVQSSYMAPAFDNNGDPIDPTLQNEGRGAVFSVVVTGDLSASTWTGCAFDGASCACNGWVRYGVRCSSRFW
jgi:hypothetical protein